MKRSMCPSASANKKRFVFPASASANAGAGGSIGRPLPGPSRPARASATAATQLVKIQAKEEDGATAPSLGAGPLRQPLQPIAPGEGVSKSCRKAFKAPVKKGSSLEDMYGQSTKSLGGRPPPPRQARFSPYLDGALVLWTPPPESCSDDVPPAEREVHIVLDPLLSNKLRPHQREGVSFIHECCRNKPDSLGPGCILADDMGLGKTLQTISVLWTLLRQGPTGKGEACNAIVISPTSLVMNWKAEVQKWLGDKLAPHFVTSDMGKEKIQQRLKQFLNTKGQLLLVSYETLQGNVELFTKGGPLGEKEHGVIICDEAHRLKNTETKVWQDLIKIKAKSKIMVTGTPVQNDLNEFYALLAFCIPDCLGTMKEFRKTFALPIQKSREIDATEKEIAKGKQADELLREKVSKIMLRRNNDVIAKYLPAKYELVVFCNLTAAQKAIYLAEVEHSNLAKQGGTGGTSTFQTLTCLRKLTSHPSLIAEQPQHAAALAGMGVLQPAARGGGFGGGGRPKLNPELSGKMATLYTLLRQVKATTSDRWVLVSNFTQTLDLFQELLTAGGMNYVRLDGSVNANKRQKMVDAFNGDPTQYAFLLSSKAGGCGLNLIGANRLILFDPDWNPANDQQALARVWRSGQQKACFIYRFLGTGTIEEKTYERQLSKEGLAGQVVDDNLDTRKFSSDELRELFEPNFDTCSTCHDSLGCDCCGPLSRGPKEDENGYTHLQPCSQQLRACDPCLAAVKDHVSLVFCRKTDHGGGGASASTSA